MNTASTLVSTGIFAFGSLLGYEVLKLDAPVAMSVGFMLVVIKATFEMGRISRRIEEWSQRNDEAHREILQALRELQQKERK